MDNGGSDRTRQIERLAGYFGAGDLAAAEAVARQLVESDRQDEQALYFLAQIVFKQGQAQNAIEPMRAALELDPTRASYHNDYGVMLASLERWDEAAAAYEMAAVLDRNNVDARFNLALALFRTHRNERARAELDRVLATQPGLPEAMALDGELLRAEGQPAEAVEAFKKAIERGLKTPEVYVNLGLAQEDLGCGEAALQSWQTAGKIDDSDDDAEVSFQLGNHYRNKGDKGDKALAERFFRRAIALRPGFAGAYNNLGLLLQGSGQWASAAACFASALASDPNLDAAHTNLGNARVHEGCMENAVDSFTRAIEINPDSADAWNNLGNACQHLHRLEESETAYRRALEIRPNYVECKLNLGLLLLSSGRFSEGWPLYESRWQNHAMAEMRPKFSAPEWDGEPLGTRALLVYPEQGLGDNLQCARYLPLLRQCYPEARIYFWSQPPFHRLFESCAAAWGIEVLPPVVAGRLPPIDAWITVMSLPWRMGTTLESVPVDVPYIAAPPTLVEKWAARLAPLTGRKVGVVWTSGTSYASHKSRTVRLKQLEPLFGVGGIDWVSLQKGDGVEQIETEGWSDRILNPMNEVEDFADTAAIIANLDLVISVDTSVPHLAGAMGAPVWLLDRFNTDWRWLLDREDSPWYPTMRIFRQMVLGEWDSVMSRAAEALAGEAAKSGDATARTPTASALRVV
ncbi:MAG: tetratricopeptide repeat protein [Candidatus Accumulibacter sp.]|jgi:tetratricopeptide (TPR) repeat protein|nr:tetratricopeptide repeat protein [Accumulibacter sp.]